MNEEFNLPVVIPDRLLISPGIWNDNEYSAQELMDAFSRTDWSDKSKISLWLNHDDRNANAFVGYVRNPKLASQGRVFGDLEIWDEKTATILTQAMAKFGVSAKIAGTENAKTGKMSNFTFENFSVVTVPACSEAYINLSKDEKEDKNISSKYLSQGRPRTEAERAKAHFKIDDEKWSKLSDEEKQNYINKLPKRGSANPELEEDKDIILSDEKSLSNIDERRLKNMEEENKIEIVEEIKELSEKEMLKELSAKFDNLITLLSKKLSEEPKEEVKEEAPAEPEAEPVVEPVEEAVEAAPVEENKELQEVKKELAEIKEKLNAPKSKTVRNLSSNTVDENAKFDVNEFCKIFGTVDGPVKFM